MIPQETESSYRSRGAVNPNLGPCHLTAWSFEILLHIKIICLNPSNNSSNQLTHLTGAWLQSCNPNEPRMTNDLWKKSLGRPRNYGTATQTMRIRPTSSMPSSSWKVRDRKRQVMVSSFLVKRIKSFPMRIEPLKRSRNGLFSKWFKSSSEKGANLPSGHDWNASRGLPKDLPKVPGPWAKFHSPHPLSSHLTLLLCPSPGPSLSFKPSQPRLLTTQGSLNTLLRHIHCQSSAPHSSCCNNDK